MLVYRYFVYRKNIALRFYTKVIKYETTQAFSIILLLRLASS